MRLKILYILLAFSITYSAIAQERASILLNSNWSFQKGELLSNSSQNTWEKVSLPHTWNASDVMDDEPGYYRGVSWYKKTIYVPSTWKNKDVYIYFEGVAQVSEVFINGKLAGKHIGSYNAFSFPVTNLIKLSSDGNTANEITIKVDNSNNENIPPLSADFTFYGGIYRDVYLIASDKVQFDRDNYASTGVFITTPLVSSDKAEVKIKGAFINKESSLKKILVTHKIIDADGNTVSQQQQKYTLKAGEKASFSQNLSPVLKPHLWSIESPYLYSVISTITDAVSNKALDEVSNPLGFKWFKFDPDKGFFLNDKPVKLIGASRHQDFKNKGNALSDAMHVRDVELLKEMGGNFLRIAHYPQDPAILQACDRLGILTSVETPLVNSITETEEFSQNSKLMHLEMIRQNFNHPSLVIWAYMNEILLKPRYEKNTPEQQAYFKSIAKLAQELEDITRQEDPARYTMIPNHGAFELYNSVGLTKIPQLVGWNLYQGWYSGEFDGFGTFLDMHHKTLPDKPLLITEYGADADNRLHSFNPIRFDKTTEYTTNYHIAYLNAMQSRPFVAAGMIWNLAEFNSETRAEAMPHINNKGILTWDRKPKDAYRFYQANLLKSPYIQIGSREWDRRSGFSTSETDLTCMQPVQVFTNQKTVSLKLNGKNIGKAEAVSGIATFNVQFVNGLNRLVAYTAANKAEITDQADISFELLSQLPTSKSLPFKEMSISLGDKRMFYDESSQQSWLPEQEYKSGSWGYVGGKMFVMEKSRRQSYGSDKNILETELDPIFETQRVGIEKFKFDVPAGNYEVSLHFAELLSNQQKEELVYNLGSTKSAEAFNERVFDVNINGKEIIKSLSNTEFLIPEHAYSTKFSITVRNNEGVTVDFIPKKGETILNGIQLRKIY